MDGRLRSSNQAHAVEQLEQQPEKKLQRDERDGEECSRRRRRAEYFRNEDEPVRAAAA
jgi:hypothetical protein